LRHVSIPIAERRMRAKTPSEWPLKRPSASKVSTSSRKKLMLRNFSHRLGLNLEMGNCEGGNKRKNKAFIWDIFSKKFYFAEDCGRMRRKVCM
jgi:hypothetical protein